LLAGTAALLLARPALAAVPTKVLFWHAMNSPLGDALNRLIARFNGSQTAIDVVGEFKGGYPETLPPLSPRGAPARRRIWCRCSTSAPARW
jgi:sn-glycerol 3-phosphate transport system substrate-binding protein